MSLRVQASTSFEATFQASASYSGLVGTVTVAIYDGVGGTVTAAHTTSIVENVVGSGSYTATMTSPSTNGQYVIEWSTGGGSPQYASEDLTVANELSLADSGSAGAAETVVLDPTSEVSTNTQVSLTNPSSGINLISQDYPEPERDRLFAGSADTFGDPLVQARFRNRTITLMVRCYGGQTTMRSRVRDLTKKAGKLAQYGGTLQRTLNDATVVTFDILDCDIHVPADWMFLHSNSVTVTLTLLAKPAGRGATTTYTTATETTNPELIFSVASPLGDLPALGKLEVTEGSGSDQWFLHWGLQCRNYPGTATASTTAALSYAGTSRLALNGSTALVVSGATSGTLLNQGTVGTSYTAVMSMASSGTAYCTHIGDYSVWARLYPGTANTGDVAVALEWGQGDSSILTRNTPVALTTTNLQYVNLGQVHLAQAVTGTQRWDGRIIAKSIADTVGGTAPATATLGVDRVMLVPTTEGYGEVRAVSQSQAITTYTARDSFDQSAGALTGKTLPVGGTWSGAGDADDFSASGSGTMTRTALNDGTALSAARLVVASGTSSLTTTQAGVVFTGARDGMLSPTLVPDADTRSGLLLRYTDTSNFVAVYILTRAAGIAGSRTIWVVQRVAGVDTATAVGTVGADSGSLVAQVFRNGLVYAYFGTEGAEVFVGRTFCPQCVTGGTLASGKAGIIDSYCGGNDSTRTYSSFYVAVPNVDAAMFASKSLQIRDTTVIREASAGSVWSKVGSYRGDYLRVPAANVGGTVRMLVKASRNEPTDGSDPGIDDISATLSVTPLYLHIP